MGSRSGECERSVTSCTTEDFCASVAGEQGAAHLKRILKLDRLRLRGPCGAKDEFLLAATAQNLRKLAKLIPQPAPAAA
jgi:hypothetical protein